MHGDFLLKGGEGSNELASSNTFWTDFSSPTSYSFFQEVFLKNIYLATPTLSCGTWNLSVVACELSAVTRKLLVAACGIQFPDQGSNLGYLY